MEKLIKNIASHVQLTDKEEKLLLSKVNVKKIKKGEYLLRSGEICRYQNFVLSGCIKTFYLERNGDQHVVSFDVENYWTGDLFSFINQTPAHFNVSCIEDSELIQISHDNIEILYKEIPKLERLFRILIQNAYVSSQMRVIDNIRLTAQEKYLKFVAKYPTLENRVPQYMVASYIGITAEFLSKIKRKILTNS